MKTLISLVAVFLPSVVWPQQPKATVGCLAVAVPPGWRVVERGSDLRAFFSGTTHQFVGRDVPDMFTAEILPPGGPDLAAFKQGILDRITLPPAEVEAIAKQATGSDADRVGLKGIGHPVVTDYFINSVPAFRVDVNTIVVLDGTKVPTSTSSVALVGKGRIYVVSASFELEREALEKPVVDAFLASINASECR